MWCTVQGMHMFASSNLLALQQLRRYTYTEHGTFRMCRAFGTHLQRDTNAHASQPRCQRREVPLHVHQIHRLPPTLNALQISALWHHPVIKPLH